MILIRYVKLTHPDSEACVGKYLPDLPLHLQQQVKAFRHTKDRQLSLFGKLLLEKTARDFGLETGVFNRLNYTAYKRPYLEGGIDFNISHSGSCVMIAMSSQGRVGIDIEAIKAIEIEEFGDFFTPEEMNDITSAPNSCQRFFHWWTQKESLMKADGRGMYLSPKELTIRNNTCLLQQQQWFLTPIPVTGDYMAHLATDWRPGAGTIDIHEIQFN